MEIRAGRGASRSAAEQALGGLGIGGDLGEGEVLLDVATPAHANESGRDPGGRPCELNRALRIRAEGREGRGEVPGQPRELTLQDGGAREHREAQVVGDVERGHSLAVEGLGLQGPRFDHREVVGKLHEAKMMPTRADLLREADELGERQMLARVPRPPQPVPGGDAIGGDAAGIDTFLVGDSLGMVVQGHDSTLPVTMDDMVYHTRCVVRGAKRAFIISDMPFGSYQLSPAQAFENAARLMAAGAQIHWLAGLLIGIVVYPAGLWLLRVFGAEEQHILESLLPAPIANRLKLIPLSR